MNTPILDFVKKYASDAPLRLHMPGHKGADVLGVEHLDITEVTGADSLYEASGIIAKSEANASLLFGCPTLYSTEGSSQCIRAMLYLTALYAKETGKPFRILAARNAHKTFLSAVALLDAEVAWLYPSETDSYLSCTPSLDVLEAHLKNGDTRPAALYLTSPDYLGTVSDVASIAALCHRYGMLLLVDNAHGAYLRFLPTSRHPIDLGADLVCDSAHKTLPVLTGGAYLHLSERLPAALRACAKNALSLFGSTSPSYLILASLDAANATLATEFPRALEAFLPRARALFDTADARGLRPRSDEPLKLTLCPKAYGYTGNAYAERLQDFGIECEFCDPDYVVLMLSPTFGDTETARIEEAFAAIERQAAIDACAPRLPHPVRVLSPRDALLSPFEQIDARLAHGRVLAAATVSCPPAVPVIVSGERIDGDTLAALAYWGITSLSVVKQ